MSTETVRRCDECGGIIAPSITHFALEILVQPMQGVATAGGQRATSGEFCGHTCVQRRIAYTLAVALAA